MFDNLLKLVKENAGDAIIKNPVIPNEKNDEAIHATTTSIFDLCISMPFSCKACREPGGLCW